MKSWTVQLVSGEIETIKAEIVTYDQAGNLIFCNQQKIQKPGQERGLELLQCINHRQYVQYYPTPTMQ